MNRKNIKKTIIMLLVACMHVYGKCTGYSKQSASLNEACSGKLYIS